MSGWQLPFGLLSMTSSEEVCVFCARPTSKRGRRCDYPLAAALHVLKRYALDGKATVGTMYDARTDRVLDSLSVYKPLLNHEEVCEKPACKLIPIDHSNRIDLLRTMDIEDDLRISLLLGIQQVNTGALLFDTFDFSLKRTVRCIDYYHVSEKVSIPTYMQVTRFVLPTSLPTTDGTHLITSVQKGFDFIMLWEFDQQESVTEIDAVLQQLCEYFKAPRICSMPTMDSEVFRTAKITLFTQNAHLRSLTQLPNPSSICQSIAEHIYSDREKDTLCYALHPVKCIYYESPHDDRVFCKMDTWLVEKIENRILPVSDQIRTVKGILDREESRQLTEQLPARVERTREILRRVEGDFNDVRSQLASIVIDYRRGNLDRTRLESELNHARIQDLESQLQQLQSSITRLQQRASLITKLQSEYQIEYLNVADLEDVDDDLEILETKLRSLDAQEQKCYLLSSTELIAKDPEQHKKFCEDLVQLRSSPRALHPIFADFSGCIFTLPSMQIVSPSSDPLEEINILIFGETGVGKSTFINALVNYLTYRSLAEAENNEPIVLIPSSFVICTGDEFEEKTINIGQPESNEDHSTVGQSVTQQCRSYVFRISDSVKVRIIDTPGVGDTRGVAQDAANIDHIVSFVSTLSHVNAVCFVLKPHTARLDMLFRYCFSQLMDFLAPHARENIVFCFTNTQATFYNPGQTLTSLKTMIGCLPEDRRPVVRKGNTFCFDSESFRYLAIVKAGAKSAFNDEQRADLAKSWEVSMNESLRFLSCIQRLPKYTMTEHRSILHAQMTIISLARPIVETMRHVLRNVALTNKQQKIDMVVHAKLAAVDACTSDSAQILEVGEFYTMEYPLDQYRTSAQGLPVLYELQWHLSDCKDPLFVSQIEKMKDRLSKATLDMVRFLRQTESSRPDPFLSWFDMVLQEETTIAAQHPSSNANKKLLYSLQQAKLKHQKELNGSLPSAADVDLNFIYQCIEEMLSYSVVSAQVDAIRQSQMAMMQRQETDVSLRSAHTATARTANENACN